MRVEWGKSHARAARWSEEVELVQEEMRRVLMYHDWKASWWRSRPACSADVGSELDGGRRAYCYKQAYIWEKIAKNFASRWRPYMQEQGLSMKDWPDHYSCSTT
jgi:hypothetical protein